MWWIFSSYGGAIEVLEAQSGAKLKLDRMDAKHIFLVLFFGYNLGLNAVKCASLRLFSSSDIISDCKCVSLGYNAHCKDKFELMLVKPRVRSELLNSRL